MGLDNAKLILLAAYRGVPMPKDCDLSDMKLYQAMRLLYEQFGMLMVTQEEAMRERDQLIEAWMKEKRNEQESIHVRLHDSDKDGGNSTGLQPRKGAST